MDGNHGLSNSFATMSCPLHRSHQQGPHQCKPWVLPSPPYTRQTLHTVQGTFPSLHPCSGLGTWVLPPFCCTRYVNPLLPLLPPLHHVHRCACAAPPLAPWERALRLHCAEPYGFPQHCRLYHAGLPCHRVMG